MKPLFVHKKGSNLLDTILLLEGCVEARVSKAVFASPGGTVYGVPNALPNSEAHPTNPLTPYGIVKLAVEKYLLLFTPPASRLGIRDAPDLQSLRSVSKPLGPTRSRGCFVDRIRVGQPVTIWGSGDRVRDYLYVDDVVNALFLAAIKRTESKVFVVGSGRGTSLKKLLNMVAGIVGDAPITENFLPGGLDVPANVLDIGRANEQLGWKPETTLEEELQPTWAWIRTLPKPLDKNISIQNAAFGS